jgi:hypothetical protein
MLRPCPPLFGGQLVEHVDLSAASRWTPLCGIVTYGTELATSRNVIVGRTLGFQADLARQLWEDTSEKALLDVKA